MSFLIPSTGTIAAILIAVPVGLVVAFAAMNPVGFLAMLAAAGAFIVQAFLKLVEGGVAAIYYVGSMLVVTIGNAFIGLLNVIISGVNAVFKAIINTIAGFLGQNINIALMPTIQFIQPPKVPPTLSSLMAEIGESLQQVKLSAGLYWEGVQQSAPGSYIAGAGMGTLASGSTYIIRKDKGTPVKKKYSPRPQPIRPPDYIVKRESGYDSSKARETPREKKKTRPKKPYRPPDYL